MTPEERAEKITPLGQAHHIDSPEGLAKHRAAIAAEVAGKAGGLMAKRTDEEELRRMVRDFLKNCPGENAGQFIADRLSLAWSLGYKAGKRDAKSE